MKPLSVPWNSKYPAQRHEALPGSAPPLAAGTDVQPTGMAEPRVARSNPTRELVWVAVKAFKLCYHNSETILFPIYIYLPVMVINFQLISSNPVVLRVQIPAQGLTGSLASADTLRMK